MNLSLKETPSAFYMFIIMWSVYLFEFIIPGDLSSWGILPRTTSGLLGIPFAPFLHHGLGHIISNSIPLLLLGFFMRISSKDKDLQIITGIAVLAGLGTWFFGSTAIHVGASGVIMGMWSYLIAKAIIDRSIPSIAIGVISFVLYGGFIFTVVDMRAHISWSSHFFGLVAGVVMANLVVALDKRKTN